MGLPQQIMGYVLGIVVDNRDPLGNGRALILIPGMFEPYHPEWAIPLGWPGAGHPKGGSKFTPKLKAQVAVMFEEGDPESTPAFLTASYGAPEGIPAGPPIIQEAFLAGAQRAGVTGDEIVEQFEQSVEDPTVAAPAELLQLDAAIDQVNEVDVIWEDDAFIMFFVSSATDKRFVLIEKTTKSRFVFNATDGAQGKSVSMELFANTSLIIRSQGIVDISGQNVQIQGRRVLVKQGVTSI